MKNEPSLFTASGCLLKQAVHAWRASYSFADPEQTAVRVEQLLREGSCHFKNTEWEVIEAPLCKQVPEHPAALTWASQSRGTLPCPPAGGTSPTLTAAAARQPSMGTQTKPLQFVGNACKAPRGHWGGKSGQKRSEYLLSGSQAEKDEKIQPKFSCFHAFLQK